MSQLQLNQILAVSKGVKTRSYATLTKLHHALAQASKLQGVSRAYKPRDDDGEQFPPESTLVQVRTNEVLIQVADTLTRLFDVELTKDAGNQQAKADIMVDGQLLAADVPVSYLLFLEKQLSDLDSFITKLPVLPPEEHWTYDPATDTYVTAPAQTVKTKKIPRNHVKAPATDKHPAQVEVYMEDVLVGYWTTMKFSGALPQSEVSRLKERVVKLQEAVKQAREKANSTVVEDQRIGSALFGYLFSHSAFLA